MPAGRCSEFNCPALARGQSNDEVIARRIEAGALFCIPNFTA